MEKLGRYHVQRQIEAHNGSVYIGSEAGSGRPATLKLVRFTEEAPSDRLAQLWRELYDEVRAAAVLQHPNIAQVFEVFQHEDKTWIATEVATDKNLASLLAEGPPLGENRIIEVLRQAAEALDYAHGKQLVHGTVRPSNLGVQSNGAVRIFGFGLAKYFLETKEGSSAADLAYLAPEHIRGQTLTGRCDQFSLAAIAYEMLTAEAPFQGTAEQIRSGIVEQEPLPADGLNPAIGPAAARVLARGLAKKPRERYASCAQFVEMLEQALPHEAEWALRERRRLGAVGADIGSKASVELVEAIARPRSDADSLVEELVAELSGEVQGAESHKLPPGSAAKDATTGEVGDSKAIGADPLRDGARSPLGRADEETKGIGPPGSNSTESWRLAIVVAGAAVILLAVSSWLYFGYGFGRAEPVETVDVEPRGLAFDTETPPPLAVPGVAYSYSLVAEGGSPPFVWGIAEGDLPPGLTLDPLTGAILGTPRVAGVYPFEVAVSDSAGGEVTSSLTVRVQAELAVRTPEVLPSGVVGQLYQHRVEGAGGNEPYLWEISGGTLPEGLSLNSDGLIVGRPRAPGAYRFAARVRDGSNTSAVQSFSMRVGSGLTLISAPELPSSSVGSPYSHRLQAGGGSPPFQWSVSGGGLPAGLTLSRAGTLEGQASSAGQYNFEVLVRDSAQASAVQSFQLTVQSALRLVTPAELPSANVSRVYSKPLELAGGNWPYRWSVAGGAFPPGLQLDEFSGTIRGAPERAGSYEFDIAVRDAFQALASRHFRLDVTTLLEIQTAYELPDAAGSGLYSRTLQAAGGGRPYLWSVAEGSLPPNFTLDPTLGVISGVPTTRGEHRFTVEVSDAAGTKATRMFRLSVIPALVFNNRGALPHGIAGEPYSHALAVTGGRSPHAWKLLDGALPDGLVLTEASGVVEGTPQTPGKYRFAVQVGDASEASTQQYFELEVKPPAPGEIIWRGQLAKDAILTIHDGRYASTGTITGALPGVPIKIDLEPRDGLAVVTAPGRANNWRLLVINASQPQTEIIIRWTPLSSL